MQIKIVTSKAEKKLFVKVAKSIYPADSAWIRPLDTVVLDAIDFEKNPFYKSGIGRAFIVIFNGRVVGRILAHVTNRHKRLHSEATGYFGLFESINDLQVARLLLGSAEEFLRDQHCDTIRGPFNINAAQEMGILVGGFDKEPAIDMAYTQPYYPALFESLNYKICLKMQTWSNPDVSDINTDEISGNRLDKINLPGFKIRHLNGYKRKQEMDLLWDLVNSSFIGNWGFIPINHEEWKMQTDPILPILDPSLILIAEVHGVPVGVTMAVPNFNEDLKFMNGKLFHPQLISMLRPTSHKAVQIILFAVRKQFQGQGISRLLNAELLKAMHQKKYTKLSITWIASNNIASLSQARSLNMSLHHELCMLEKLL